MNLAHTTAVDARSRCFRFVPVTSLHQERGTSSAETKGRRDNLYRMAVSCTEFPVETRALDVSVYHGECFRNPCHRCSVTYVASVTEVADPSCACASITMTILQVCNISAGCAAQHHPGHTAVHTGHRLRATNSQPGTTRAS